MCPLDKTPTARPPRRRQEDRTAEAKAAIRKSALELFALQGYDTTTLSQISTRVNFSRGLAQYHYKTKEALAEELMDEAVALHVRYHGLEADSHTRSMDVIEHLEYQIDQSAQAMSYLLSSEEALEIRGLVMLTSFATFSPHDFLRNKIRKHNDIIGSRIREAICDAQTSGIVRSDVDPQAVAVFYIGSTWGIAHELFAEPDNHQKIMSGFDLLRQFIRSLRNQESASLR